MKSGTSKKRTRYLFFALNLVTAALLLAAPLRAWKPITHVHLALAARADAIDDGMVTIYEVNFETGEVLTDARGSRKVIGHYPVNPAMLSAIRAYPAQFKAGAIGPDAYPDILTGQMGIHPDNKEKNGNYSNDWLELVWENARKGNSQRARAFASGFLVHAAGDLFGHTFVNNYSGGPFDLGENALKHIVLESYIDKRTPQNDPDFFDASIEGVEDFIHQQLVIGPFIGQAGFTDLARDYDYYFNYAPPRLFAGLRHWVAEKYRDLGQDFLRKDREYREKHNQLVKEVQSVQLTNPVESAKLAAKASALMTEWTAYRTAAAAAILYFDNWRKDIDEGLKAWAPMCHELAKALFFKPGEADTEQARNIIQNYANAHFYSMVGAPDIIGDSLAVAKKWDEFCREKIPFCDPIKELLKFDLEIYLLKKAWGVTWDIIKQPDVHFDEVMNHTTTNIPCEEISLKDFNQRILKIQDEGYSSSEKYDWTKIPAMHNSVAMMKLLMISESGVQQLMSDMEEKGYTSNTMDSLISASPHEVPLILGYMKSLDYSNQWCEDPVMLAARDPCVYRKIFMKQAGDKPPSCLAACDFPDDGEVTSRPYDNPLAAGSGASLLKKNDASAWFWGTAFAGEVGHGRYKEVAIPSRIEKLPPVVSCAVGLGNYTALAADGTVWVWGENAHGQAGLRSTINPMEPVQAPNLSSITMVAAGALHYLALRSNGTVWAWGGNSNGECGFGEKPAPRPKRIPGLNFVKYISAGMHHSLAVCTDGSVWVWGSNYGGQIGDGTKENRFHPVRVTSINNVVAVAGGGYFSLALKADGTVWAWGKNLQGQLGDGTKEEKLHPVQVSGLSRIIAVSAGDTHAAALQNDGTVWVWGANHFDQLGNGKRSDPSLQPIKVSGLPRITAIAAGWNHTLGLAENGDVWIWGQGHPLPAKVMRIIP